LETINPQRNPVFGFLQRISELRRHHADDGQVSAAQEHLFPEHTRIASETALPQPVAEDHDRGGVIDLSFLFRERAA
jgi:hypothetical protein